MQPASTGRLDENDLVRALRVLAVQLAQVARLHAQRLGLAESDLAVLNALDRHGWQSTEELAHRSRCDPAALAVDLPRLENDGWIYTTPAPAVTSPTPTVKAAETAETASTTNTAEGGHRPGGTLVGLQPAAAARLCDAFHHLDSTSSR